MSNQQHLTQAFPTQCPRRSFAVLCLLGIQLLASACSSAPSAAIPAYRVLIQFRDPVAGAAPDLLLRLQRQAGVGIYYDTAVAPNLYAYGLSCSAGDPDCDAAIRALRRDPGVLEVSPDRLRNPSAKTR
jgi:hypothetical protein